MDWNNLQVLVVLSREGSLAGAARALGVNHATISRRLSALEAEIGAGLVRRLARSTPLTEKGHEIVALAAEMEDRARRIERLKTQPGDAIDDTVRLAAPPAFLSDSLVPELTPLAAQHPDLRLVFVADPQINSIEQGEADMAVRLSEPRGQQNIVRKLGDVHYALYGAAAHMAQPPNRWRYIGFDRDLAHTQLHKWLSHKAGARGFAVVSNDPQVQKSAATAGLGLALLPEAIGEATEGLERVEMEGAPSLTAWLVIHPDVKASPAVRVVVERIMGLFDTRQSHGR